MILVNTAEGRLKLTTKEEEAPDYADIYIPEMEGYGT
jgi:hypothetical protein